MKISRGKTAEVPQNRKKKRWRKGHSSDSNPETKKHRLAAKNRFFHRVEGSGGLTEAVLAKHNEAQNDAESESMFTDDAGSVSGKTFNTWATNYTDCTNATFSKVHRYWHSNSAQHKEILAVLAAVTEVIKTQGGNETETEYFGALMTALETMEGDETLAAVAYLLSLAIKRVPHTVLKTKFSEVSKCLMETLGKHVDTNTTSLLRSVIICLASVLRVQDQVVWTSASTMQVYHGLLVFISHAKPKVRKAAQESVRVILKGSAFMISANAPPHHPAASATAKYCIQQIEECGGTGEATETKHTLELLKNILAVLPANSLKSCCETILKLMTLSNVVVTSVSMRCLHNMFVMQPKNSSLTAALNAQLINALYEYVPGENDVQPVTAWLAVMEKAHINLAKMDNKLCLNHLPRFFASCMTCLLSERQEVQFATAKTLKAIVAECLTDTSIVENMLHAAPKGQLTAVHKLFKSVEGGLSYQYHAAWGLVLQVLATVFQVLGKSCHSIMKGCLRSLADLRDSHDFAFKGELDHAVAMALKAMGPRTVLEAIPLQITGRNDDYNFPRSWLLPVMRDHVQETELQFFTQYFLPLAAKLRAKGAECARENRTVESKTYEILQQQIWSLLPAFCNKPIDLPEAFPGIAKILGSAIVDRPDLRQDVMASIRKLVTHNLEPGKNREVLARFAKNYLPLLFNIYTGDMEKSKATGKDTRKLAVLETAKCYLQISDKQLVHVYFDKCMEKIQGDGAGKRYELMDLAIAELPYVDSQRLAVLFSFVSNNLESTDHTVQKKCYRMLEEMCAGKSAACKSFVSSNLLSLQQILLQTLSSSGPSSKGPRLRCLAHIVNQLEDAEMNFVTAVVPEAILCTKENGERPRQAAYSLLVEMANAVIRWSGEAEQEALKQYFQLVLAGLAGSAHMISATELALTRILFEFKNKIDDSLLGCIVENACVLLGAKAREIVNSALGLVKVILSAFPETKLAQYLQKMVSSLVQMKEDNKHHFRFRAKEVFLKLARKFGYQVIHGMLPVSHHKLLAHIKKTEERAKRKRKETAQSKSDDESGDEFKSSKPAQESIDDLLKDSDSEDEPEQAKAASGVKKTKRGAAWLREGVKDDIVDFLDPSVSRKVLATEPKVQENRKPVKHDFKLAPDGRFIIQADEDEKQPKKGKRAAAEIDDIDELLDALGGPSKGKKRKRTADSLDDDDGLPMKYEAGGSGIHRPLDVGPKEPGAEYRSRKAKGDMKKKDKPDPYAYIPLNVKYLNKRKRAKAAGQFKNLVKGARQGASKGTKMKRKK